MDILIYILLIICLILLYVIYNLDKQIKNTYKNQEIMWERIMDLEEMVFTGQLTTENGVVFNLEYFNKKDEAEDNV